jgi:hypothetical protein
MKIWKIDLEYLAEEETQYKPWAARGATAFCVHDLRAGDYEKVRDWMRSDALRGNRKLTKTRYHDEEYDRQCVDLTVMFDHKDDSDRFSKAWCDTWSTAVAEAAHSWMSFF